MKYWKILYDVEEDQFLDIPFTLNHDVCRIVYLYHDWEGGLYKNNIGNFALGALELPLNKGNQPMPWLLIQTPEYISLKKTNGWYATMRFMDEEAVTGKKILEMISDGNGVHSESANLRHDLYGFLSTQFHVHHLIHPATVTSSVDKSLNQIKQERCTTN
jgi:hypothetical protein